MKIERPVSKQPLPENAKKVFTGKLFDVYQWEVEDFNGNKKTFEKVKRPDTAVVIPVTPEGKIIIAREEQPGKKPFFTTLGGRIEEGEEPLSAAMRELLEETGMKAESWSLLHAHQPMSKTEWAIFTFIAKGAVKVTEQELDGGEKIELIELSLAEFMNAVLSPEFDDVALKLTILEAKADPQKMTMFENALGLL